MRRKIILLPVIIILSIVAGFIFTLKGCLQHHNNYGVVGTPAISRDGKTVTVVITENEATTYSENASYRKTTYKTSYWLKQYETATGNLVKKKKLINHADLNNRSVAIYGIYENKLWLHLSGLQAVDLATLEQVTNEEKITKANGLIDEVFPYEDRLINAYVAKGYIDFTSDKGEAYRLWLKSLIISNKENLKDEHEDDDEKNITRLLHDDDNYGARADTLNNTMYILAKDSTEAMNTNPYNSSTHEVTYRMKFFNISYSTRKLGMHDTYVYNKILTPGNTTYLNPVFAKDSYSNKVVHFSNPVGYLVIHQDLIGEKSKAIITRIDTANKKVWETASGVSTKISACVVSGKYCILTTNKDYMFSPFIGKDALCIINTETGNITNVKLSD